MDGWIVVPNWNRFQHYTDRNPPWVKLYTELNRRDDWRALRYSDRGLVCSIWSEYGVANGHLRARDLGSRLGQRVDSRALVRLSDAGFLTISASKPLALARSREKKVSETEKNYLGAAREKAKPTAAEQAIERLIRNGVINDIVDLEAEIAGLHLQGTPADRLRQML